jgi:hypothetical protein
MNQRIQLLSEQAEKYADDNFRGEPTWSEAFESKFAELIVKECISIAQDRAAFDWAPPNDVNHIINEIKEHFGVEE